MNPLHIVSYVIGGLVLMNALPHVISAQQGRKFPSPFANPPGQGLSSCIVNVVWGFANLVVAYGLICRVGQFDLHQAGDIVPLAIGMFGGALMNAYAFGRLNGGTGPGTA